MTKEGNFSSIRPLAQVDDAEARARRLSIETTLREGVVRLTSRCGGHVRLHLIAPVDGRPAEITVRADGTCWQNTPGKGGHGQLLARLDPSVCVMRMIAEWRLVGQGGRRSYYSVCAR